MTEELQTVIEDNLVQLRHDTEVAQEDAPESESRLLSNLVVLIAAGQVANPSSVCSEVLGRIEEQRLLRGLTQEIIDPATVREEMGSHRFTYLDLRHGDVQACYEVFQSEARSHPDLANDVVTTAEAQLLESLKEASEEWPLKEVPSQRCVVLGEDLPNFPGTFPNIMDLVDRMARMPHSDRQRFERSGKILRLRWDPFSDTFSLATATGVTWTFNKWDMSPKRV